jgi:RimJ/RimL family protein N-acetyltransferase
MSDLAQVFPVLGLGITAGPLQLAGMDDDTLVTLADLAAEGIHEPDAMPFEIPWTLTPPETFRLAFLQHHWRVRADFGPSAWDLDLAVRYEGDLVGTQGVSTRDFLVTRTGETGSWLGRRFQGRGIGTLMRQALCAFLFDHLGFEEITSGAFLDNPASQTVSRKVGYQPNGVGRKRRREGEWAAHQRFLLTPDGLVRGPDLQVEGVQPLRRLLGLDG